MGSFDDLIVWGDNSFWGSMQENMCRLGEWATELLYYKSLLIKTASLTKAACRACCSKLTFVGLSETLQILCECALCRHFASTPCTCSCTSSSWLCALTCNTFMQYFHSNQLSLCQSYFFAHQPFLLIRITSGVTAQSVFPSYPFKEAWVVLVLHAHS